MCVLYVVRSLYLYLYLCLSVLLLSPLPDDPGAWDASCRHHVIPVSPFQPFNNSPDCLLHVAWLIEQAAQRFFSSVHAALPDAHLPRVHMRALSGLLPAPAAASVEAQAQAQEAEQDDALLAASESAPVKLDKRIKSAVKAQKIVDIVHALVNYSM